MFISYPTFLKPHTKIIYLMTATYSESLPRFKCRLISPISPPNNNSNPIHSCFFLCSFHILTLSFVESLGPQVIQQSNRKLGPGTLSLKQQYITKSIIGQNLVVRSIFKGVGDQMTLPFNPWQWKVTS